MNLKHAGESGLQTRLVAYPWRKKGSYAVPEPVLV